MNELSMWQTRLGYYVVNNKPILSKSMALLEASKTKSSVSWNFNDQVYGSYDWKNPIPESLPELYRRRAQQIRDKYDHLVLYFSGGADSINVLHSFIDNGIFIDEIAIQYPKPVEQFMNNHDTSNQNYYSEAKYSAIPHLKKIAHKLDSRTRIRHVDQVDAAHDMLGSDDWFEKFPPGLWLSPTSISRQISAITDPELDHLYTQGKTVCQIYGVDKPIVWVDGVNGYHIMFVDASAIHSVPTGFDLGDLASKFFFLEFFYWTPDMPEIVIKQAQEIKKYCDINHELRDFLKVSRNAAELRRLHPIIYGEESLNIAFQAGKPMGNVFMPMSAWFWKDDKFKIAQKNFMGVVDHLGRNIDPRFCNGSSILNGFTPIVSRAYTI